MPTAAPFIRINISLADVSNPRKTSAVQQPIVHNRIVAIMAHTTRYAFRGESRLADDAGISRSALCRLINGQTSPSFAVVSTITRALSKALGTALNPHDVISMDGTYPTASVCVLAGCRGCLPDEAYDEDDNLKPEYRNVKPGHWHPFNGRFSLD